MAKVISTVAQTLALDNSDKTDRTMAVSAHVTVGGGKIQSITHGMADDGAGHRVTFQSYSGTGNMRIEFNNATDRQAVVEAIDAFIVDIEANIDNLNADAQ